MKLRVLTAVVLIPIVVAIIWFAPPLLLAGAAALVAIFALNEFFDLAARQGATGFKKWTIACSAALFYAQYSLGLVETRNLNGAILLINGGEGRTLSMEAVLLIFVSWSGHDWTFHTPIASGGLAGSVGERGRNSFRGISFQLFWCVLTRCPILGRRLLLFTLCWSGRATCSRISWAVTGSRADGSRAQPEENLGGRARKFIWIAACGGGICALAASGCGESDGHRRSRKRCWTNGRSHRISVQARRFGKGFWLAAARSWRDV